MAQPKKNEYPDFYSPYIEVLNGTSNLMENLEASLELFEELFYELPEEKYEFRYQEGKWTIKEVVQHLIDAERVFVYRALRFSRKDQNSLAGYDENEYVSNYDINRRDFNSLLDEFCLLRRSTLIMFENFENVELDLLGEVEGNFISVRALGFICSGHVLHHINIVKERYL